MTLWPCFVCARLDYCAHREHALVAFAVERAGPGAEMIPDPLPEQPSALLRKPPAREIAAAAARQRGGVR
jgi:hypothetical protein